MAPVIKVLSQDNAFDVKVCVTAQHRQMLDQVLRLFNICPDFDLNLMQAGQDLSDITSRVLLGMRQVFQQWRPDMVLVHGDTTTTLAASLAAFYAQVKVAHVEAGLRTHDKQAPWPEEINRHVTGVLAHLHFAPTEKARSNLLAEGVPTSAIHVVGNTAIDAVLGMAERLRTDTALREQCQTRFGFLVANTPLVLVTCHRRENLGPHLQHICAAIRSIASRGNVQLVFPVHMNPKISKPVHTMLAGIANIHLVAPLDYLQFVYLMGRSDLVLTDSGGLQEEAPALNKPVLLMRTTTERPEAVAAGTVRLVGTQKDVIVQEVDQLLNNLSARRAMPQAHNPFGSGNTAAAIHQILYASCQVKSALSA